VGEWSFEHTVATRAARADAWAYWSDLRNHMRLEPGVERIELDGPFVTGTTGRTVALGLTSDWRRKGRAVDYGLATYHLPSMRCSDSPDIRVRDVGDVGLRNSGWVVLTAADLTCA
jgi:hypothetical protein